MNMQNLGRESKLRRALVAPPGYKVVAADASQIECRLGAWLADWTWLLDQFRDPTQDPYANYASQLFEKHVVPKAKTPERFVGKQSLLSLQFGASWVSFQRMCRVMGNLELTQEQAEVYVSKYRKLAAPIKQFWALCARLIKAMADGDFMQHKCIFTRFEEIRLPSGLALNYPGLWFDKKTGINFPAESEKQNFSTWRYGDTGIGLFGGKLMENLCQSLARVIVTDAGTRIRRKHKIHYKMQVHDELIYIVPDEQAEWLRELLVQELSITPVWAPGLPLAAEGKIGINYGEMG
jgi:DNA polymerase I-like protein with 3'-5' exonuclease and polymerase domains